MGKRLWDRAAYAAEEIKSSIFWLRGVFLALKSRFWEFLLTLRYYVATMLGYINSAGPKQGLYLTTLFFTPESSPSAGGGMKNS